MSWPTITAAIIARDEASNLPGLLAELDWVDEIVVVDGGSHDGTAELARTHGCRVARREFDSFAAQRNHAIRLAQGDWIFSIDADERPTARLVGEVVRTIGDTPYAAFRIAVRSRVFGSPVRRSGTQDDRPVRLFRRGAACWSGDVHEVLRVGGRIGRLGGWLEHETLADVDVFMSKVDRYTALEAAARVARGQPPGRGEAWMAPAREVFRRLIWKLGLLDGPAGWRFSVFSGLSEWELSRRHRRLWVTGRK